MKHQSILLCIIAVTICFVFPGCGGAVSAPIPSKTEEKETPISFLRDHAVGIETARQERKPVLMFFSVPGSVGSQRMLETTFCGEEVKRLADRFVCVHVDGTQEATLCQSLNIADFPTILLSNTNGTEVCRLIGRQTPDQLAFQMQIVLQATVAQRPRTTTGL